MIEWQNSESQKGVKANPATKEFRETNKRMTELLKVLGRKNQYMMKVLMTMTSRFPTTYQYHPYIDEYMRMVENGEIQSCKEQKLLMKFLRWKLDQPGVVIDSEAIENQ